MADTLTITDNRTGKTYEVPIEDGTIKAMDLRQIRTGDDDFGLMTYDPAFQNTASCRSRITYIDGDKGILLYRGYPIEQLAEHSTFLETAYLILFGELPTQAQLDVVDAAKSRCTRCFTRTSRSSWRASSTTPIRWASCSRRVGCLSTIYPDAKRISPEDSRRLQIRRLIAKVPTIAAWAYRHSIGRPLRVSGQRPELHRQLPEHAVQDDGAQVQA